MGSDRKSKEKKSKRRSYSSESEDEKKRKRHRTEEDEEKKNRRREKKEKGKEKKSHKHSKDRSDKGEGKFINYQFDKEEGLRDLEALFSTIKKQEGVEISGREKKSKDKHKSKHSKGDSHMGIQELSKDDYFSKNNEFATWLKDEKNVFFSELSSESARELFSDFVKAWNRGNLESRYYEGISSGPRTGHNWKIKA